MLVAKTVLKNPTDQNVLSVISCKPVMTFARDYDLHSVCQCMISQLIVKEASITESQLRLCKSKAYVAHMEQGSIHQPFADGKSGRMMSARVTLYKICSHFIFVLKDYRLLIKETLSCAC